MATFFITKWCLTRGIEEMQGVVSQEHYAKCGIAFCRIGKDAFYTIEEARANAVDKARAKLKSVLRERDKLEALLKEWSS